MKHIIRPFSALAALTGAMALAAPSLRSPLTVESVGQSTVITYPAGNISITPVSENIVRIARLQNPKRPHLPVSKSAVLQPDSASPFRLILSPDKYQAASDAMTLSVNRASGRIDIINAAGDTVLSDLPQMQSKDTNSISLLLPQGAGQLYGGGERGHSLALNGDSLSLYNRQNYGYTGSDPRISQMGISIPYIASDKGVAVLFDDFAKAAVFPGDTLTYVSESPEQLSYYVIVADKDNNNLSNLTSHYTALTGRQPLPPLWALGYITSKYGYHNQNEAYGVIDSLKQQNYPVDGMVLDLYWYGKETDMGRLAWDKEQWPDHQKMLADLKAQGVNTVLITQPYINKIGALDNYNHLDSLGLLTHNADGQTHDVTTWVGRAGMFDVSNPATKAWLWNRLRPLTQEGVAGWWGDLGEPEVHPDSIVHHNGLPASLYHNQYGNDWSELIYNGLRSDFPEMRPMLMMRGGTAGLQRFGVFPWTTDVSRTWGGLQPQVKLMLSSGLSGLGYMSSDLGGFAVDPSLPDDPELYARWLQMGTFTPMMRTHAQKNPEPYHFPSVADISHQYINMRYEWLPYNYSLALENSLFGFPLARPLNFSGDNPNPKYADIDDEYLWGSEVLVAPVMKKGARSRKVTFPAGKWISWWHPELSYNGNTTATVKAPLDELPLFVRAGSFIPQYALKIANTGQYDPTYLWLRYFPGTHESSYTMYEDDRKDPESLQKGEFMSLTFAANTVKGVTTISLAADGKYPDMPVTRTITITMELQKKAPRKVLMRSQHGVMNLTNTISPAMQTPQQLRAVKSEAALSSYTYHYSASTHTLTIRIPWGYSPTWIEILP